MAYSRFKRLVVKLSGEALVDDHGFGISRKTIRYVADEIRSIFDLGIQIAVVVGGGNFIRGSAAGSYGMDRASADHMGMLATVINSLALQDALGKKRYFYTRYERHIHTRGGRTLYPSKSGSPS